MQDFFCLSTLISFIPYLNMTTIIRPMGMLKDYIGGQKEIAIKSGHTIREAMVSFGMPPEVVALIVVNDEHQTKDCVLKDGDVVRLLAVIGGG
jgi:sulfur carrier protein ThiS